MQGTSGIVDECGCCAGSRVDEIHMRERVRSDVVLALDVMNLEIVPAIVLVATRDRAVCGSSLGSSDRCRL